MFPPACYPRASTANRLGYDADAQAFFTAAGITDATQKSAVNQLVLDLKGAGFWTGMVGLYPFVGGTSTSHSYNLKNSAAFQITWSGTVTHDANGITGDGTTGYGNLGIIPATHLVKASNHISLYFRTVLADSGFETGSFGPEYHLLGINGAHDAVNIRLSCRIIFASTAAGHLLNSRINDTDMALYLNGSQEGATNAVDVSATTASGTAMYICGWNNNGSPDGRTARNIALASYGGGLTAGNAASFNTIVQTFQTTLGRNV